MEQKQKLATTLTTEDENWINGGQTEEDKTFRRSIIVAALHLNGSMDSANPGISTSYIPDDAFYQLLDDEARKDKYPAAFYDLVEQALNWHALGRGKGGLAGAMVRFRLKDTIERTRETNLITHISKEHLDIAKEYAAYSNNHSKFAGVWYANAFNVLGLAVSSFVRECHHWNPSNTKGISALIGSLSQENELAESEWRKLFYLAIHPIPLKYFPKVYKIARAKDQVDISETVRIRLNVAPAGYADICACAIAAKSFVKEDFAKRSRIIKDVVQILHIAETLKHDPIAYHPFATSMGVDHVEFQKAPYTEAMIILAAYAKTCIGGTLGNSPALMKFTDTHLRRVNALSKSFKTYMDNKSEDIIKILTGEDDVDIANVVEKIKPIAKAAEKLRNMAEDKDSPVFKAAIMLEGKIQSIVSHMDESLIPEIDIRSIKPLVMPTQVVQFAFTEADDVSKVPTKHS